MTHTKLHRVYKFLEYWNDAIVPGRGKLVGVNPKYDVISPVDLIPVVGPLNKINRLRKLSKVSKVRKWLWITVFGPGDILMAKEGIDYIRSRRESGAPPTSSPKAPTKAVSTSRSSRRSCPKGMRWDGKKGKCVRIRKR